MDSNWRNSSLCQKLLLVLMALFILPTTSAGGFTQLPRNLGPFKLGMPETTFTNITAVKPNVCSMCIDNESFASLSANDVRQIIPRFPVGSGIDFFFYNKALYHIALGPKEHDLFTVKQNFETIFGAGTETDAISGNSVIQWEDKITSITLNYNKVNNEVFSINYYDWRQKQVRDFDESKILDANNEIDKTFDGDLLDLPPLPVASQ